jgi:hypothetical protein
VVNLSSGRASRVRVNSNGANPVSGRVWRAREANVSYWDTLLRRNDPSRMFGRKAQICGGGLIVLQKKPSNAFLLAS